ncbi:MAG: His-Xaa-Ser system radical SAM maturase HxsB [Elusimicrobia bacterium]|nr:His-Xaa-Ser system radical SAM maturase HxsB [Elusimicrobiota bacterium]
MNTSVLKKFNAETTGFFRFAKLNGKYLITNDCGGYKFLTEKELELFIKGKLPKSGKTYQSLEHGGFVRNCLDFDSMISSWRERHSYLWRGPTLHIIVVTLRCDHRCVYCHASSRREGDKGFDMTLQTARRVVDTIFESPNNNISIEFQGGEPLLNWPCVKEIVDYSLAKAKKSGKKLRINLVTNLTRMTKEKFNFLTQRGVSFCTSLDGPQDIHNKNRVWTGGNSYKNTVKWFKEIYKKTKGKPSNIDALLTVVKGSLGNHKKIIDEYVSMGARGIFLRFLNPLGMAKDVWESVGYTPAQFLNFYEKSLDYIVGLNSEKKVFMENMALVFLIKILTDVDPGFVDNRSPCGGGLGQIAYNYDGKAFTCDEARMLYEMGDSSFCIGDVKKAGYKDIINHTAERCLASASCLETQSACDACVYKPYCGVCPVLNYATENDLFCHGPGNVRCIMYKGILDIIFKRMEKPKYKKVFERWVNLRVN